MVMAWGWSMGIMLGAMCVLLMIGLPVAFSFIAVNFLGAIALPRRRCRARPAGAQFDRLADQLHPGADPALHPDGRSAAAYRRRLPRRQRHRTHDLARARPLADRRGRRRHDLLARCRARRWRTPRCSARPLMPEMLRRGYHPSIAMGPIMATGGIAMLIPPSALAVLLGSLAGISIAKLLVAGIIPGLMMCGAVHRLHRRALRASTRRSRRRATTAAAAGWARAGGPSSSMSCRCSLIFVVVIGSVLGGIADATEFGGARLRRLGRRRGRLPRADAGATLIVSLRETAQITVMILFIIVALGRPSRRSSPSPARPTASSPVIERSGLRLSDSHRHDAASCCSSAASSTRSAC